MGIACYRGPQYENHVERGRCNLVEGGSTVGEELVQVSDRTLHNAVASLTETTAVWCYADSENAYELKCEKVNRDDTALSTEHSGELLIRPNSSSVLGSSVLSATRFSDETAVVCADNPGVQAETPENTGPLICALVFIKPADDEYCASCLGVNSNSGIISEDTGNILTASVISFTADTGAVCYTSSEEDGDRVSCTMLAISGSTEANYTLAFGNTLVVSADAASAAATALSADAGLVCYTEGAAASCSKLQLDGSAMSKGEAALQISPTAVSRLTLAAFSNETVAVCFQDSAGGDGASCNALDVVGGTLGDALSISDAAAGQQLALVSLTDTAGFLCYEKASGEGVCMDLQVLPQTTTTETSTATSTVTTTYATETATGTTSTTGTSGTTETGTTKTETSTTPHSTTETSTSTTPHTTTESSTTTTVVFDSGASMVGSFGRATASVLVALGLTAF